MVRRNDISRRKRRKGRRRRRRQESRMMMMMTKTMTPRITHRKTMVMKVRKIQSGCPPSVHSGELTRKEMRISTKVKYG